MNRGFSDPFPAIEEKNYSMLENHDWHIHRGVSIKVWIVSLNIQSLSYLVYFMVSLYKTTFKNFFRGERRLKEYMNFKYQNRTDSPKGVWRAILVNLPSRHSSAKTLFNHMTNIRYVIQVFAAALRYLKIISSYFNFIEKDEFLMFCKFHEFHTFNVSKNI